MLADAQGPMPRSTITPGLMHSWI